MDPTECRAIVPGMMYRRNLDLMKDQSGTLRNDSVWYGDLTVRREQEFSSDLFGIVGQDASI